MKIRLTYSNSVKALIVVAFAAAFYLAMFVLFNFLSVKENLFVNAQCSLESQDMYKCVYSCTIMTNCKTDSLTQRTMVLHSASAAVYDKIQNVSCRQNKVVIDLPYRDYSYDARFILFDDNYYGKSDGFLKC